MTISTTGTQPRRTQVVRIWRQNRCLRSSAIRLYLRWVRRFQAYCRAQDLEEGSQLTLAGVDTFATWYAKRQGIDRNLAFEGARSALPVVCRGIWDGCLTVIGTGNRRKILRI
jgi:hypothetical protein